MVLVNFGPDSQNLSLDNSDTVSPVLGLQLNRVKYSFFIQFKAEKISDLSKKKLLSVVYSIFD